MPIADLPQAEQDIFGPLAELLLDGEAREEGAEPDNRDTQTIVRAAVEEALQWREENLDDAQAEATDYYMGRPFGDEKKGRSQVVITTVRDAVQSVLPSLMRIFHGNERVVEFQPQGPEDVPLARQQTDYINHVVTRENDGFSVFQSVFKDALVRKIGVVKYWWEEKVRITGHHYSGMTAEEVALLEREEGVTLEGEAEPDGFVEGTQEPTFRVYLKRRVDKGCARFDAVPSEEFVWSPSARNLDEARMVAHVREVAGDELVAMGVPRDMVTRNQGPSKHRAGEGHQLQEARRIDEQADDDHGEDEQHSSTRPVLFADVYMELDEDEDGIAEIRRVQCVGDGYEIWKNDCVDEKPFALFPLDPEPHTMIGLSLADYVKDLQRINSAVARGMMDSLAQHLNPITEIVEGEVNMKDFLNPSVGRGVRVRRPGVMREVETRFVGRDALPVLQWLENIEERRTGRQNGAMGLDADTLQSSTKAAVAATLSAAQQRVELYARTFAETGMKTLYRGLYKLTVRNKKQSEMVRLRNQFVEVDPREWQAERDVIVNVALGATTPEDKIALLDKTLEAQLMAMERGMPIVSTVELRNTLARRLEAGGYRDVSEFWKPWDEQAEAQYQQALAQAPPPQPSPDVVLTAEVQREQIQAQQMEKMSELRVKIEELRRKDDRERDKIIRDFIAKMAKVGVEVDKAKLEEARVALDQDLAAQDTLVRMGEMLDQALQPTEQGPSE